MKVMIFNYLHFTVGYINCYMYLSYIFVVFINSQYTAVWPTIEEAISLCLYKKRKDNALSVEQILTSNKRPNYPFKPNDTFHNPILYVCFHPHLPTSNPHVMVDSDGAKHAIILSHYLRGTHSSDKVGSVLLITAPLHVPHSLTFCPSLCLTICC